MNRKHLVRAGLIATLLLFALGEAAAHAQSPKPGGTLAVKSSAFPSEGNTPTEYTCEGANISPPLAWSTPPAGTKTLALICDDPDAPAGTWVHWVLYNLPASSTALPEKVAPTATLPNGAMQGTNDFGKLGYGGPCAPTGNSHHYFFKVYALDIALPLRPGATRKDLLTAMEHHTLAEGLLMAKYQRKK